MSDQIYYSNEAIKVITWITLGQQDYGTLTAQLFINPVTPQASNTFYSTYQSILCSNAGYAPITLRPGNWLITTADEQTTAKYQPFGWTFSTYSTSPVTIYGMILVMQLATVEYLYAEIPFDTPFKIPNSGRNFIYTITWNQQSCQCPCGSPSSSSSPSPSPSPSSS